MKRGGGTRPRAGLQRRLTVRKEREEREGGNERNGNSRVVDKVLTFAHNRSSASLGLFNVR